MADYQYTFSYADTVWRMDQVYYAVASPQHAVISNYVEETKPVSDESYAREVMGNQVPLYCYNCDHHDGKFIDADDPDRHHYACPDCTIEMDRNKDIDKQRNDLITRHRIEHDEAEDLGESLLYQCPECGKDMRGGCECRDLCRRCFRRPCTCGRFASRIRRDAQDAASQAQSLIADIEYQNEREDHHW